MPIPCGSLGPSRLPAARNTLAAGFVSTGTAVGARADSLSDLGRGEQAARRRAAAGPRGRPGVGDRDVPVCDNAGLPRDCAVEIQIVVELKS